MILWEEIEKISKVRRMYVGGIEHILARALFELKKENEDLRRCVVQLQKPKPSNPKKKEGA